MRDFHCHLATRHFQSRCGDTSAVRSSLPPDTQLAHRRDRVEIVKCFVAARHPNVNSDVRTCLGLWGWMVAPFAHMIYFSPHAWQTSWAIDFTFVCTTLLKQTLLVFWRLFGGSCARCRNSEGISGGMQGVEYPELLLELPGELFRIYVALSATPMLCRCTTCVFSH